MFQHWNIVFRLLLMMVAFFMMRILFRWVWWDSVFLMISYERTNNFNKLLFIKKARNNIKNFKNLCIKNILLRRLCHTVIIIKIMLPFLTEILIKMNFWKKWVLFKDALTIEVILKLMHYQKSSLQCKPY